VLHGTFARYLVVLFIFTLGNASDAFLLLRATELGVSPALVPVLWGVHHLSKVIWSLPGGALADRLGARPAIIAGWLVYAATYGAFAVASQAWQAWALFIAYGLFYGLTEAPERALVAALAPAHQRGSAFGAYHMAIGIGALPASLLFGFLSVRAGSPVALMTGAGLALAAALGLLLLVRPAATIHVHSTGAA
jgi:MFS family permease